jgi:hypothetical protein
MWAQDTRLAVSVHLRVRWDPNAYFNILHFGAHPPPQFKQYSPNIRTEGSPRLYFHLVAHNVTHQISLTQAFHISTAVFPLTNSQH